MDIIEVICQYFLSIFFLCMVYLTTIQVRKIKKLNNKQKRLKKYITNFTLRKGNPFRTILLPFTIMFILNGFYPLLGVPPLDMISAIIIFPIMVIIQPLVEEIIIRSMLFGSFVTKINKMKETAIIGTFAYSMVFIGGFLLQNLLFMLMHLQLNLPTFISGMLYSVFFLDGFDKKTGQRNILPAWAAHSSHNLLIWLGQIGLVTTGWVWAFTGLFAL